MANYFLALIVKDLSNLKRKKRNITLAANVYKIDGLQKTLFWPQKLMQ